MDKKGAAIVTGAARRIGRAIAKNLADAGYDLALHASDRSKATAESVAHEIAETGARTCVIIGDLEDGAFCRSLVSKAAAEIGPLGLLVNNAAIFGVDSADDLDLALWDRHFAVNLRAPVMLAHDFAHRTARGQNPSIVNMIDQRVLRPTPQFFSYTLAKSALWTATRTMAQTFAERGIRVNAIGPGPVLPNETDGDEGFQREVDGVLLRQAVDPQEIAAAVLYLAGARAVTGQIIAVDAGQHLGWRTPDVVE